MAVSLNTALAAYRDAARTTDSSAAASARTGAAAAPKPGESFSDLLHDTLTQAVDAGRKSESASLLALQGKADLREVVNAVANAETALQTVVAVRDKVVSAYQEILKMSI